MKILAEDHSFAISNRDGRVKHPPFQIIGGLAAPLEEGFEIFDPLLKK
jgi:hypothetical protein